MFGVQFIFEPLLQTQNMNELHRPDAPANLRQRIVLLFFAQTDPAAGKLRDLTQVLLFYLQVLLKHCDFLLTDHFIQ